MSLKICVLNDVLWNTVWVLYASLKHTAKEAEIQKNRNMKAIKTFPYKDNDCKD